MNNKARNEVLHDLFMSIAPEYEYTFNQDEEKFMSTFPFYTLEGDRCVLSTKADIIPTNYGIVTPKKVYRTAIPFTRLKIDTLKIFEDPQTSVKNELNIEDSSSDQDIEIKSDIFNAFKVTAKRRKICQPMNISDESMEVGATVMSPGTTVGDGTAVFAPSDLYL